MSAANTGAPALITLDELEGLIKRLGMLGSAHDGEVLAAARFVCRWLDQHGTDWRTLLTPEEEIGVVGVVAADEVGPLQSELDTAYQRGFVAGLQTMRQQVKAQAGPGSPLGQGYGNPWMGAAASGLGSSAAGLAGGLGGQPPSQAVWPPPPSGAAQAASGGAPAGVSPTNTWKTVALELLHRHDSGIPGVFRGSREETFVRDVLGRGFPNLTQAQEVWLRDIAGRSGMRW